MGNSKVKVSDSQASAQALAVVSGVGSAVAVGVVLVVVLVAELVGSLEPDSRRKRTIKKVNVSDVQHKICCCHPIIHYRSCASLNTITKQIHIASMRIQSKLTTVGGRVGGKVGGIVGGLVGEIVIGMVGGRVVGGFVGAFSRNKRSEVRECGTSIGVSVLGRVWTK